MDGMPSRRLLARKALIMRTRIANIVQLGHGVEVDISYVVLEALNKGNNEILGLLESVTVPVPCYTPKNLVILWVYLPEEEPLRAVDVGNGQVLDGDEDKHRMDGRDLLNEVREYWRDALY